MTRPAHGQAAYARRLEWGLAGAHALVADARPGDVAVVVDVLSFTTTLTVAVEQGLAVHPYPWRAEDAAAYAAERGATLAVGRREGLATGSVSLSPVSFLGVSGVERVVLPSPNGSAISFALAEAGVTVVGAALRNAGAVAGWLRDRRASTRVGGGRGRTVAGRRAATRCRGPVGCRGRAGRSRRRPAPARRRPWPSLRSMVSRTDLGFRCAGVRQWARAGRGRLRRRRGPGGGVRRQRGRARALR